ncbi:MAG: EAL domain-containing protein [Rhodocyclales bacterium]|nr:EAL domain-containing protein [Rhodocyclales bacterium]
MRIRSFIMAASAVVAVGFFGASYVVVGRILEHTVRENARDASAALAQVAFTGMYQLMSTGWQRKQALQFVTAIRDTARDTPTEVQIYRGPVVVADHGEIEQPPLDAALRETLAAARPLIDERDGGVRYLMPLVAEQRCIRCHSSAEVGQALGAIEVKQDFAPLVAKARREFMLWLLGLAPLLMGAAALAVWRVSRRIEASVVAVSQVVAQVNGVADLRQLEFTRYDPGFTEFHDLFSHLNDLVAKLRQVAVDKHVLRFEIGLMEKFVITSEVVRDWGEYIARLLAEINTVMPTHMLFSLFEVGDEVFDLEVFWSRPPVPETRRIMEEHMRRLVAEDSRFSGLSQITLHHHAPSGGEPLELDAEEVALHTKTLMVERPKIGGIVGIGVNAEVVDDDTLRLVMDSILSTMLNVVGSVKAIHKYTRDMEYYATRDPLTDLYNRRVFWELFDYEVARAQRHGYRFALLVVDLDNFKLINDSHGHVVGDRYLQRFAPAVKQVLRPGDIFARYGGDEFVILLPDITQGAALVVAQRVLEAARAMEVETQDGGKVSGSASIGLALYPQHAENSEDLFLFADNMLFKAKNAGKHQVGIPSEEEVAEVFRDMTETTVQVVNAINEGRIVPFFQPIMALDGNRIVGFEVLSRIAIEGEQHMEAARFIEFAEKAGVIHRLDSMVMEKALRNIAAIEFSGYVFINLSPRALALSDFMQSLRGIVASCGIAPAQIVFEITERDTVKNIVVLEKLVGELKLAGFKLAIDDFGSGFSSFQYLRRFPVDFLKIEGDFIAKILENKKDRAFVQTIAQLAADLKIQVIAEHVESAEVLEELRAMGIDLAQGYYIGRPESELGRNMRWPLI